MKKILTKFLNLLKGTTKPNKQIEAIDRRLKALELFAETTARIILKHNDRLDKSIKVHEALLEVLVENEKSIDRANELINQHAQVINAMQKDFYKQPEPKAEATASKDEINVSDYITKKSEKKEN